jgi:WD40 repeat protein/serine/threonine protein kinase
MSEDEEKKGDNSSSNDPADFPTLSKIGSVEEIGSQIGPYKLLSVLGEGGFGIVYLAEQKEPVRRQVALKVIKPGMDSKQVIGRFEQERQALALLDHPNIAHVFDGGTTEAGRPYFVMELVKGHKITEYCDDKKLSIEERLDLFRRVCEAVQHAHQKGIIHRDLKPSNILVQVFDDKPVPIIIDFGIAKAISQSLTEKTLFTEQGKFIGTPEYMSPEQAEMTNQDIDTRSDIYSLGVLLYELLTGALPFDSDTLRAAAFDEVIRIIRDEDPPQPSTRLLSLGGKATTVATNRRTDVKALSKRLHKELEWIPLKAMRKEPDRRYKTASELADDAMNYLNGDPLVAGPESRTYRLKKTIKRHRVVVSAVVAVLIVLAIGIAVSALFAVRALKAERTERYMRITAEDARKKEASARAEAERAIDEKDSALKEKEAALAKVKEERDKAKRAEISAEEAGTREIMARRVSEKRLYMARIGLAQQAWENGNIAEMLNLLDSLHPEKDQQDIRDFVWYYLLRLSTANHTTLHNDSPVWSVSFSPSGETIATNGANGVIRLWDFESGHEKTTLRGHNGDVLSLAFSPDGKTLASGSNDKTVRLWDITVGKELIRLPVTAGVSNVTFSQDGRMLAAGLTNGSAILWDVESSPQVLGMIRMGEFPKRSVVVAFSPDGKTLAIGGGEYDQRSDVRLWDIETRQVCKTLQGHMDSIRSIAFSPNGQMLATASHDRTVRLWDSVSGRQLHIGDNHTAPLWYVAFSPDGESLATASSDHTVRLWDAKSLQELQVFKGHTSLVISLSFSPDGKTLASSSSDATVILWNIDTPREAGDRLNHESAVYSIAFSPNDDVLLAGCENGNVVLWNPATERQIGLLIGHAGPIWSVAISTDGRIATGSADGTVKLWDKNGDLLFNLANHATEVYSVAFSPDGETLAAICRDMSLTLWNLVDKTDRVITNIVNSIRSYSANPASSIAFSPDGRILATGHWSNPDSIVHLWDVTTGRDQPVSYGHYFQTWSVAFSPDGSMLASTNEYRTLNLWDLNKRKNSTTLEGHTGPVLTAIFSPDSKLVASGSEDKTVRLWDVGLGEQEIVLVGHEAPVTSVAFSSKGHILASASTDNSVILWRAANKEDISE